MGNISSSELYADGEGIVFFDESGNVDEMSLTLWDTQISVGSLMGNNSTNAGIFALLLIDDVLYLGTGNDEESVVWHSADVSDVNFNRNFFSMMPTRYFTGQQGANDWMRHDDVEIPDLMTAHSFVIGGINNNPASTAFGLLGSMSGSSSDDSLGGALIGSMLGSMFDSELQLQSTYFGSVIVDPETELLHGLHIQTTTSSDVSNMLGSMNDDMFGSLLSSMVGTESAMSMIYNMTITDYNETIEWEPPTGAIPLTRAELNTLLAYGNGGMDVMLQNYFIMQASSQAMAMAMGGTGGSNSSGSSASASMTANLLSEINTGSTNGQLTSGQMDSYPFEVTEAGQTVEISLNSSAFDPYLEVRDENGSVLYYNDDDNGLNSRIMAVFPEAGTYTIIARGFRSNAAGSYTLSIGDVGTASSSNTGAANTTLSAGDVISGTLRSNVEDLYTISVDETSVVTIALNSSRFDPYLELFRGGTYITENDDYNGLNSRIQQTLSPGVYTVVARGFSSSASGAYTLSIDIEASSSAGAAAASGGEIGVGDSVNGSLASGSENIYTLILSQPTNVTINLDSSSFDPYLELHQNGILIAQNDDANRLNSEINATLNAGTYTIVARSYRSSSSGSYTLSVSGQTASAASTTSRVLEPNASAAGRLVRGARDQWTLVISEQTPVTIQLNSNDFDTYLELYQGSSRINYNDDANGSLNSEIETTLQPGTYTVVARGFSESASGAYSLIYFER
ncbi:MAG: PPC domain-containing protein [Anaerolineae bacterium]|nr:PPC domain-containing protein [Anaerolineae bacterium]